MGLLLDVIIGFRKQNKKCFETYVSKNLIFLKKRTKVKAFFIYLLISSTIRCNNKNQKRLDLKEL